MSSFHRGDYRRMRRGLTIALLEAEAMEPRVQLAYAEGAIPEAVPAKMGLVRLFLNRADRITRHALDIAIGDTGHYHDAYADSTFTDRRLAATDPADDDQLLDRRGQIVHLQVNAGDSLVEVPVTLAE